MQRLLALQQPEGYEPRYSSFSGLVTEFKYPQLEIFFNLRAWTGMPRRLREIFIWDSFVETKPLKGTFQLELPQRPDYPISLAPQAVVNLVFSQLGVSPQPHSERGLNFRIGYVNRAPAIPGYIQQISWATRSQGDPIKELLDNPQYSSLRQELFEELREWLEMCLRQRNITWTTSKVD